MKTIFKDFPYLKPDERDYKYLKEEAQKRYKK